MSEQKGNKWVMDYETLSNCFVACFHHYSRDERYEFVVHESRNDFDKFMSFLKQHRDNNEWHISFNGLAFDAQITEFCLRNERKLSGLTGEHIARILYEKAQDVIHRTNTRQFQEWPEWKLSIPQIDLFKLNHWDNAAKMSSLKWIQCSIDWPNVLDMPIHHTAFISDYEIPTILEYCHNDVGATKKIMWYCREQIGLRGKLTQEYDINLWSASEPKISRDLFLLFLEQKTGIPKRDLKSINTKRTEIRVKDIILPYIRFENQEFKMLLNNLNNHVIDPNNIKGSFKYTVRYKGVKTDLGLGGIHGFRKKGIYESGNGYTIMTVDVQSFYPNLAIRNRWAPAHISKKDFCEQYEWFFEERKKIPKSDPRNYVFKIVLNSTYGLSIEPNSFMYDAQLGMTITINGQLLICLLSEMLCEGLAQSTLLMQNTDGLEIIIKDEDKSRFYEICKQWEQLTNLVLEYDEYDKLWLFDVNNYFGLFKSGKSKCKGRFEFEPQEKYEANVLHKNKSYLIIPKAIFHYFTKGIKPEDYLQQNRRIFDYCGLTRARGDWKFMRHRVEKAQLISEEIQKTLRYYISNRGSKIIKVNKSDGRKTQIEAGQWEQTVFNLYEDKSWEEYDVNDKYYLNKIYTEIQAIEPKKKNQLQLEL